MRLIKIISWSAFQLISVAFFLLYLLGVLNIYFSDRSNYCTMTYMFEYPQFVRISVPENIQYPQYKLYAYSEGRLTEKARKMRFDGIPVLYLPGNSGSHMQGRSIASVALRMALSDAQEYHFDFFMVSYNEDLSGVYGGVLQSETEFASACITRILNLYKDNKYTKTVPSTVILIGHSMGGVIAKRLLAYPETIHTTSIAIALAAPLEAPVINFDKAINDYYTLIDMEWGFYIKEFPEIAEKKVLLSFGNGARDLLMPSGLTASNHSDINALTTAIPGVWTSPDHVSIVWCKQLVMAITRYLFDIVNTNTMQIHTDKKILMDKARQYFVANRSMILDPGKYRETVNMISDAFWYEDNRRTYQISRPDIDKTTYLMIRLVGFPQNRFVAIQSVNVDDKDWIFGCAANQVYGSHRYCKQATSLSELSRWSAAPKEFGKRKLATVHLHDVMDKYPEWTHVVVKVSPTRKPIVLNVDINDYASRSITVDLPGLFSSTTVKQETEQGSIYYELVLPGFDTVGQAYLLSVEPVQSCKASSYLVSAELHVPWAENNEVTHYYSHLKQSPMKLRLFRSNPNVTLGSEATQHATVTLVLDPQCTYTISISSSWYFKLAQLVRNYSHMLIPYVAAILLLAARSNIQHLRDHGTAVSIHTALMSEGVKPYYCLVFSRLGFVAAASVPVLSFVFNHSTRNNLELLHFSRSLLVLPTYMTALGIVNVATLAIMCVMVFSSQLAHRLLFRIVWRGGSTVAEHVATGLQKVPLLVSATLVFAAPVSCGAAALLLGAAFYAFMISKMYEEYLEDYVYKLMAKVTARLCRMFRSKRNMDSEVNNDNSDKVESEEPKAIEDSSHEVKAIEGNVDSAEAKDSKENDTPAAENKKDNPKRTEKLKTVNLVTKDKASPALEDKSETKAIEKTKNVDTEASNKMALSVNENDTTEDLSLLPSTSKCAEEVEEEEKESKSKKKLRRVKSDEEIDEELNNLNFHMTMFLLWVIVTLVNGPALLTWARNFKYSMALKPDTSFHTGIVMSACSSCIWQMQGPRGKLKHYDQVSSLLFTMAVVILTLGPFALYIVNYGVTFMFAVITLQQLLDKDTTTVTEIEENEQNENKENKENDKPNVTNNEDAKTDDPKASSSRENEERKEEADATTEECDPCNESQIYSAFKKIREKLDFTGDYFNH